MMNPNGFGGFGGEIWHSCGPWSMLKSVVHVYDSYACSDELNDCEIPGPSVITVSHDSENVVPWTVSAPDSTTLLDTVPVHGCTSLLAIASAEAGVAVLVGAVSAVAASVVAAPLFG